MPSCLLALSLLAVAWPATLAAGNPASPKSATLHVAVHGNDAWPGTQDQPFATLGRARDAARQLNKQGPVGPVRILIGGGVYDLATTLELRPEDSGREDAPVTWEAAPGQRVLIRGCRKIVDWQPHRDGIYRADLKAQGLGGAAFWQLFYQGGGPFAERQVLARHPNFDPSHPRSGGNVYVASDTEGRRGRSEIVYRPGDLPFERWGDVSQAEVVSTYNLGWMFAIAPIRSMDPACRLITVRECRGQFRALNRFFVQNVLDALDAPGEWFLDRKAGVLYFYPPGGKLRGDVLVPVLDHLIRLDGTIPYGHGWLNVAWKRPRSEFPWPEGTSDPVAHVRFVGLDFEGARQDAIRMTGARRCEVLRCRITNVGNIGVNIGGLTSSFPEVGNPRVTPATGEPVGAGGGGQILLANDPGQECRVEGCDLWDIGCEGVMLYGTANVAQNNHVWDIGLYAKDCPCINLLGQGNVARRNTLHDCPRCAIFIKGDDNVAELNDVHHAVLETCDMGAIRFVNRNKHLAGNVVRHNLIRAVTGYGISRKDRLTYDWPFYTWGIYLDDYTCNTAVVGNIIADVARGGIMVHGGGNNLLAENLVVDAGAYQVEYAPIGDRPEFEDVFAGNRCERNVLVSTRPNSVPYRFTRPDHNVPRFADNVVWCGGRAPAVITRGNLGIKDWQKWLAKGCDRGSVVADPKVQDTGDGRYRLAADSPAWKMGFKEIPIDQIGCYADPARASWPLTPNWDRRREQMVLFHEPGHEPKGLVFDEVIDELAPVDEDFERFAVGSRPAAGDIADAPAARITVTDELASAGGAKCLRIPDAPGLAKNFLPRVYWPFDFREGLAVFRADFRLDGRLPGKFFVDPRQYGDTGEKEYLSGPTVSVEPDGQVRCASGPLTKVPLDAWFRIELHMPLGTAGTGQSQVVIAVQGQSSRSFTVKNSSPGFRRLNRVVISSMATTQTLFYVDNVSCRPQ